jgi:3-oxoacyl-[acyl-carrier-protein] synthase-3
MTKAKITGVGHYVPETVVTNKELEQYMDTSDEWIRERTGIQERRFFQEGEDTVSKMGARAANIALERAGVDASAIDFIVFATLSPDYHFPGPGVLLQRELGLAPIGALDVRDQCSGFIYGLSVADSFIQTGKYQNILLVGSEIQSNVMELSDRGRAMAVIFGDGAGAAVVQATDEPDKGVLSTKLHADGNFAEELMVQHPGSNLKERVTHEMVDDGSLLPYMNGRLVFKHAVHRMPEVIYETLDDTNYTSSDIDLLIPHQANLRISEAVQQKMGFGEEQVFNNIQKYGNTTAASIPLAMSEAWEEGRIWDDLLLTLAAFGSGFTWASALVKW